MHTILQQMRNADLLEMRKPSAPNLSPEDQTGGVCCRARHEVRFCACKSKNSGYIYSKRFILNFSPPRDQSHLQYNIPNVMVQLMRKKKASVARDLLKEGQMAGLVRLSADGKRIEYLKHGISRDFTKPEAPVEAKAYLSLILQYDYPYECIRLFSPVTIGSSQREADIEVYFDVKQEKPLIIVECKKEIATEAHRANIFRKGKKHWDR